MAQHPSDQNEMTYQTGPPPLPPRKALSGGWRVVIALMAVLTLLSACGHTTDATPDFDPADQAFLQDLHSVWDFSPSDASTNYRTASDTASPSTTEDTGQDDASYSWLDNAFGALVIADGRLTAVGGGEGRGFRGVDAGAAITRIGGRFTFKSGGFSTTDGDVVIGVSNELITGTVDTSFRIGVHVTLSETGWEIAKFTNATGTVVSTSLLVGNWSQFLTADGVTEYEMDIFIRGNTFWVAMPDGSVQTVTDSDISTWATRYAFHEIILASATSHLPGWTETWVDTAAVTEVPSPDPVGTFLGVRGEIGYATSSASFHPAASADFGTSTANVSGLSVSTPKLARPIWLEVNLRSFLSTDGTDSINTIGIVNSAGGFLATGIVDLRGTAFGGIPAPILRVRIPPGTNADTWQVRACTFAATPANVTVNVSTQTMYISAVAV